MEANLCMRITRIQAPGLHQVYSQVRLNTVISSWLVLRNNLCDSEHNVNHLCHYRLLDSMVVECWLRVREVPGSILSHGPRHTKDVIKMVPVVPLFSTEHSKGKILALSHELR